MSAPSDPPVTVPDPAEYVAEVWRSSPTTLAGFVHHRTDHALHPVVEMLIDGLPVALARAETYRADLEKAGIGDGRYGFSFVLAPDVVAAGGLVQVGLANLGVVLAPPIALERPAALRDDRGGGAGGVEWAGGLRLSGWLAPGRDPARLRVRVEVEGELVADSPPGTWRQHGRGARATPAFLIHLPERFATGRTHLVVVTDGAGTPLIGSPLTLVAFPEPLEALAARVYGPDAGPLGARARLFDTLSPASLPLSDLDTWQRRFPLPRPSAPPRRLAVAMIGATSQDVPRTSASFEEAGPTATTALPSPDGVGFSPIDLVAFLEGEAAGCGSLLVLPAGTRLEPGAVARFADALDADRHARLVYGDLAIGPPGAETALAFPSFDYERWLEQGYGALLFALPLAHALAAAQAGADSLYRLALAQIEDPSRARAEIVHLPGIAGTLPCLDCSAAARRLREASEGHLRARAMPAQVLPAHGAILPAVRVTRPVPEARVSLVMVVRDRPDDLARCLASIRPARARARAELVVIDNGSSAPEMVALLDEMRAEGGAVLTDHRPFDRARLMNRAVQEAGGELVCLLDPGIEARDDAWLPEMLSRLGEPTTAAVGAMLRGPGGVVRHAGIVLGPGFAASHAMTDRLAEEPGYADLLRVASEPSAVTAACLLVRRAAFLAVGGFDERTCPGQFAAVDLCLRLSARGERVVLTPHLDLVQHDAADLTSLRPDARTRRERELTALRARWGATLLADPAYSPLLALTEPPYAALACPPRALAPRRRSISEPSVLPSGL